MKRTLLYLLLLPALLSGTCLLAAGPAGNAGHGAKPCLRRLTCEGLTDPLAIDTATPRFGWQLRSGRRGDAQRSYRIEVASDSLRLLAEQTQASAISNPTTNRRAPRRTMNLSRCRKSLS